MTVPAVRKEVSIQTLMQLSQLLAQGKMFPHPDKRPLNEGEIFSIVEYGRELGLEPIVSLMNIIPVKGRLCTTASCMLGLARNAGVRYEIKVQSDTRSEILFTREGQPPFLSTFTQEEARTAGLLGKDNWKNYPVDMYRSRAIARGCRVMAPDVLAGLYLTDEINPDIHLANDDLVVDVQMDTKAASNEQVPTPPQPQPQRNNPKPADDSLSTEPQRRAIHTIMTRNGINNFDGPFRDFLYEDVGILDVTKRLASMTKNNASSFISGPNKIITDFYAEAKYHDELRGIFEGLDIDECKKIIASMLSLVSDRSMIPTFSIEAMTQSQAVECFGLLLKSIEYEEDNRRKGSPAFESHDEAVRFAADLFDVPKERIETFKSEPISAAQSFFSGGRK